MTRHPSSRVRLSWKRSGHQVVPVDLAVRSACRLMIDGELAKARQLFEDIRVSAPDHPSALTMLGSIAYQEGHETLGDTYIDRAISVLLTPAVPSLANDTGRLAPLVNLLLARARHDEAEALAMRLDLPFNPIRSDDDAYERLRKQALARQLPSVLLVTLPKTASESLWHALSSGLAVPQVHLALGLFPDCCVLPFRAHAFARGGLCAKDHLLPTAHNLTSLRRAGIERVIVHLRDPRQIALSWAHFVSRDVAARVLAPIWRKVVPPRTVLLAGIAAVVDWSIERLIPMAVGFTARWLEVAREGRMEVLFTSFEAFAEAPERVLSRILAHYEMPYACFASNAAAQAEDVHWRRGEAAEWRAVFTRQQRLRAAALIPDALAQEVNWNRSA